MAKKIYTNLFVSFNKLLAAIEDNDKRIVRVLFFNNLTNARKHYKACNDLPVLNTNDPFNGFDFISLMPLEMDKWYTNNINQMIDIAKEDLFIPHDLCPLIKYIQEHNLERRSRFTHADNGLEYIIHNVEYKQVHGTNNYNFLIVDFAYCPLIRYYDV